MLASIRGTVIQKSDFSVVIECNGFGVEALVSRRAADLCKTGEQTFLYTYLQISDAGIALYGFALFIYLGEPYISTDRDHPQREIDILVLPLKELWSDKDRYFIDLYLKKSCYPVVSELMKSREHSQHYDYENNTCCYIHALIFLSIISSA